MPNLAQQFPKEGEWGDFSARLVGYYKLPFGSMFGLVAKSGRRVRSDKLVRRKRIARQQHTIEPDLTVRDILDRVQAMVALRFGPHAYRLRAIGPDGSELHGHTKLATWRSMDPKPTPAQLNARALRAEEIERHLKPNARSALVEIEEGIEDAEDKVPQAVLGAMIDYYGTSHVKAAVAELRL